MKRALCCVALVVAPILSLACLDATAIDVRIYTDQPCTTPAGTVAILAQSSLADLDKALQQGVSGPSARSCTPGTPDAYVGDIVLLPSRSLDETMAFAVMSRLDGTDPSSCGELADNKCIVSIRTVQFVPHRTQTVCVHLETSCAGKCGTQTCVDGACVDPPIATPCP